MCYTLVKLQSGKSAFAGGGNMKKRDKIIISVIAIVFSFGATGIGCGITGGLSLGMGMKFVCNFFFIMQSLATCSVIIGLFKSK